MELGELLLDVPPGSLGLLEQLTAFLELALERVAAALGGRLLLARLVACPLLILQGLLQLLDPLLVLLGLRVGLPYLGHISCTNRSHSDMSALSPHSPCLVLVHVESACISAIFGHCFSSCCGGLSCWP